MDNGVSGWARIPVLVTVAGIARVSGPALGVWLRSGAKHKTSRHKTSNTLRHYRIYPRNHLRARTLSLKVGRGEQGFKDARRNRKLSDRKCFNPLRTPREAHPLPFPAFRNSNLPSLTENPAASSPHGFPCLDRALFQTLIIIRSLQGKVTDSQGIKIKRRRILQIRELWMA